MKADLQMILTSLISLIVVFSIGGSQNSISYAEVKDRGSSSNNPLVPIVDNNIFGNLTKQFGSITKQFEYTVDLDGKHIFPNDTVKQDIVTKYKAADYNISNLNYKLLGFDVIASNIRIHVEPSRIDQTTTRVDFPVMIASNVTVTNGSTNSKYSEVNIGSIYGIYNKSTDKMTMHIPSSVALQYLLHI